jgi:hypothetical protein
MVEGHKGMNLISSPLGEAPLGNLWVLTECGRLDGKGSVLVNLSATDYAKV